MEWSAEFRQAAALDRRFKEVQQRLAQPGTSSGWTGSLEIRGREVRGVEADQLDRTFKFLASPKGLAYLHELVLCVLADFDKETLARLEKNGRNKAIGRGGTGRDIRPSQEETRKEEATIEANIRFLLDQGVTVEQFSRLLEAHKPKTAEVEKSPVPTPEKKEESKHAEEKEAKTREDVVDHLVRSGVDAGRFEKAANQKYFSAEIQALKLLFFKGLSIAGDHPKNDAKVLGLSLPQAAIGDKQRSDEDLLLRALAAKELVKLFNTAVSRCARMDKRLHSAYFGYWDEEGYHPRYETIELDDHWKDLSEPRYKHEGFTVDKEMERDGSTSFQVARRRDPTIGNYAMYVFQGMAGQHSPEGMAGAMLGGLLACAWSSTLGKTYANSISAERARRFETARVLEDLFRDLPGPPGGGPDDDGPPPPPPPPAGGLAAPGPAAPEKPTVEPKEQENVGEKVRMRSRSSIGADAWEYRADEFDRIADLLKAEGGDTPNVFGHIFALTFWGKTWNDGALEKALASLAGEVVARRITEIINLDSGEVTKEGATVLTPLHAAKCKELLTEINRFRVTDHGRRFAAAQELCSRRLFEAICPAGKEEEATKAESLGKFVADEHGYAVMELIGKYIDLETGEVTSVGESVLTPEYSVKWNEFVRQRVSQRVLKDLYPLGDRVTRWSKVSLEAELADLHGKEKAQKIRSLINLETGELTDSGRATLTSDVASDCERFIRSLNKHRADPRCGPSETFSQACRQREEAKRITKEQMGRLSRLICRTERQRGCEAGKEL